MDNVTGSAAAEAVHEGTDFLSALFGTPLGILIFDYKGDYNESKWDFRQATQAKVLKPYHLF